MMAMMLFTEGSDTANAQLFDERGNLIGKGKYIGQKKTGEWNYFQNSKVVSTENFLDGQKTGHCKRYYSTGEILEESNWKLNKLDGLYRIYFQEGKTYLECTYSDGQLNGLFKTWFENGKPEIEANYDHNVRDKDWKYFDETGNVRYVLKFNRGKLTNPEIQDSIDRVKFESYKRKADNLPDPEKFVQNPEEYMRLMQNH
jgi:antitoxin component YwqK of YwqJK toxin-antitoxin module